MMKQVTILSLSLFILSFGSAAMAEMQTQMIKVASSNPCNPCAPKKMNPCGAKNACNPCAGDAPIDKKMVLRPKGTKIYSKDSRKKLVAMGGKLFKDGKLSTNGLSCNSCHSTPDLFSASFMKPYPHSVSMAKQRSGLTKINADEFVQFCMIVPMVAKPLPWESKELAALTAYVKEVKQKEFIKMVKANPCFLKKKKANPCGGKNPCMAKNPCGHKNPCGNNPCNPCGKHKAGLQ